MIIDVTYPYTVELIRKNHRKSETRYMIGTVPVLVREVTAEQAPLAATVSWKTALGHLGSENPLMEGKVHAERVEIRKFDGKFWMPLTIQNYDGRERKHYAGDADDLVKQITYSSDWRIREGHPDFGDIIIRSIESSDEEAQRASFSTHGDDYIMIEGAPFTTTTEPVYTVVQSSGFSRDSYVYLRTSFLEEGKEQTKTYRADRLDAALAHLERLKGSPIDDEWLESRQDNLIDVVDPTLLDYRDEAVALQYSARLYLTSFRDEDILAQADLPFMKAYIDLRNNLATNEVDDLTDHLAALIEENARLDLYNYQLKHAMKAIRRYSELSEPQFDHDLVRALAMS